MNPPVPFDQRQQPDGDRLELCGETSVASLWDAYLPTGAPLVMPHDVAQWIRDYSGGEQSVSNGTDWSHLAAWIDAAGGSSRDVGWDQLPDVFAHDHGAIVLIHDNGNGDPDVNGPYFHWIVCYGPPVPSPDTWAMNPWGGRLVTYGGELPPAVIECHEVCPPADGESLMSSEATDIYNRLGDLYGALTRLTYASILNRWEPPEGGQWAQGMAANGADATMATILSTPEAQTAMAARAAHGGAGEPQDPPPAGPGGPPKGPPPAGPGGYPGGPPPGCGLPALEAAILRSVLTAVGAAGGAAAAALGAHGSLSTAMAAGAAAGAAALGIRGLGEGAVDSQRH